MEFRILGPVEVRDGGATVPVGGPTARAVLAALLLHPDETVGVDRFAADVWGSDLPRDPTANLQSHISRLRGALDGAVEIEHHGGGYVFHVGDGDVDLERARRFADEADQHADSGDMRAASEALRRALALWRGEPLAGLGDVPLVAHHRPRLREMRLSLLERRLDADLAIGRHEEILGELELLSSEHPFRERFHAQRMLALYGVGRQAEALEVYRDVRTRLVDELGVEPGEELREVHGSILRQELDAGPARSSRDASWRRQRLPRPLTSFVGRHHDLSRVMALLDDVRLVTLTGPGGAGKTRLSLEVARRAEQAARDGVWLLELASVPDPELVGRELADMLGVAVQPGTPAIPSIADAVGDAALLLVLDNCEHLIDAAAELAERLLWDCPNLRILATSREPLRCDGEHVWPVSTLEAPPEGAPETRTAVLRFPAVELFRDRARAADATFELTDDNAGHVAGICRAMDGIPLAIELAAARVGSTTCRRIAERVGTGKLEGGRRTADPRHHSLQAALDWSHELLTETERRLFHALSVFEGSFPPEAASYVTPVNLRDVGTTQVETVLDELVAKSLVAQAHEGDSPRFRLLEPVRQYAIRHLWENGDPGAVRDAHVDWCLELVRRWGDEPPHEGSQDPHDVVDSYRDIELQLEAEHDDLRSAVAWVLDRGDKQRALALIAPMWTFWWQHGYLDHAAEWLRMAVDQPGDADDRLVAQGLTGLAFCHVMQGRWQEALPAAQAAVKRYREVCEDGRTDEQHYAYALFTLALIDTHNGDLKAARRSHEEGATIIRRRVNPWGDAFAAEVRTRIALAEDDAHAAQQILEDELAAARRNNLDLIIVTCAHYLGRLALEAGDHTHAISNLEESLAARRRSGADRLGDFHGSIITDLHDLALAHLRSGDRSAAHTYATEGRHLAALREHEQLEAACAHIIHECADAPDEDSRRSQSGS